MRTSFALLFLGLFLSPLLWAKGPYAVSGAYTMGFGEGALSGPEFAGTFEVPLELEPGLRFSVGPRFGYEAWKVDSEGAYDFHAYTYNFGLDAQIEQPYEGVDLFARTGFFVLAGAASVQPKFQTGEKQFTLSGFGTHLEGGVKKTLINSFAAFAAFGIRWWRVSISGSEGNEFDVLDLALLKQSLDPLLSLGVEWSFGP